VDVSRIFVHGCGAVSPAGWGVAPLIDAVSNNTPIPLRDLPRPGWEVPLRARQVPPPEPKPAFLAQARFRRSSPITQYSVAAALEAIGDDLARVQAGNLRLGVVLCVMSGCVNYSRRFYDEVLRDPATASPLVFPETVFNAPASHLAALLGSPAVNYTLVGDPGMFLQGVALASQWLIANHADACLVVGGEECDWLTTGAFRLFSRGIILSDGAGALYLKRDKEGARAELSAVTDSHSFNGRQTRLQAARSCRAQLPSCAPDQLLTDGLQQTPRFDDDEIKAWEDWTAARLSPKAALGEGLIAAAGWQCITAVEALGAGCTAANVSVVGCNQQAIGAHFVRVNHAD
jgi:3-oxoacyl-(acyl-carrier-protein) synthase